MLWGEGHIKNKNMETKSINQKQRDDFARMLEQAKERAHRKLESDYALDSRVESEITPKLAKEHGAAELVTKIQSLYEEADKARESLSEQGFDYSRGAGISISSDAPKVLKSALREAQQSARQERDLSMRKFDLALLNIITVNTADDARKIVEGLL
jgi:hypothetical protein